MSTVKVNKIEKRSGSTLTLGGPGTAVTLACGATQTGFGRTGTVDWQTTPKTATFTAVSGEGYFANTSGGAFNMNLPAGVAGAIVSVADYSGTFQTNNLTIVPNGSDKIGSQNENATLKTEGQSVTLVFVDSTQGWINTMDSTSNVRGESFMSASGGTETTSGNYKIHTFNSSATFTVNSIGSGDVGSQVSYMVVAGGGGGAGNGGNADASGGGGAGGFREGKQACGAYTASPLATTGLAVTAQGYPITIGAGGAKGTPSTPGSNRGVKGVDTTFSTITSAGGGGGNSSAAGCAPVQNGGSGGGGGGGGGSPASTTAGVGNTPPVSPSQGFPGGTGHPAGSSVGGGGGGATVQGADRNGSPGCGGGPGGNGATTSINASPTAFAGGGGGGTYSAPTSTAGIGGTGGGGAAGRSPVSPPNAGVDGTANTGGGGGAGSTPGGADNGGAGGSGIVIIRYKFQ